MPEELYLRSERRPTAYGVAAVGSPTPLRQMMTLRAEGLVEQARGVVETRTKKLRVDLRMEAGYELAERLALRARQYGEVVRQLGDDPDLHQLHTYIKMAATEAIIDVMQGRG